MDVSPDVSTSTVKSKLLMVSTLLSPRISTKVTVNSEEDAAPTEVSFRISVVAKFLRPLGWTRLLTGLTMSFHSCLLLIS